MKTIKEAAKEYAKKEAILNHKFTNEADKRTAEHACYKTALQMAEFTQRWIPVEEELPEVGNLVQIKLKEFHTDTVYYDHDKVIKVTDDFNMFDCEQCNVKVIAWRPIEYK